MVKVSDVPQRSTRNLLDDSDSESDGGAPVAAADFKVNQEFARRFEHNKQREEKHRLEEKFKGGKAPAGDNNDDDDDSSSDESEDEDGFLATEDLDAQISATLQAIRNKDPKVYDKEVTFYKNTDEPTTTAGKDKDKKDKPVYLRDYHREKLLAGDVGEFDDNDDDTPQQTYYQEQDALKKSIMSEINAVAAGDDEEDDGFMTRKPQAKPDPSGVHPSRKATLKVTELDVTNADKNPETFLSNFMSARAWVPPDGSNWKAFESDEGEGDDRADEFEQAYNLRFEDPDKSNEVLRTYARDLAAAKSARREEKTGRKRQRELEREQKEEEKQKRRDEKARLRKLKLDEAEGKLRKIKQAVGSAGKEFNDEDWIKFLDDAWENDKWEEEMRKRFGDEYYAQTDDIAVSDVDESDAEVSKKKKRTKKPKWEDDIDINDIIPDFEDEEKPKISLSDVEDDDAEEGQDEVGEDEDAPPSKKRKTADHKRTRQEAQKKARQERSKLEALVDSKLELTNHALLNNPNHTPFRYRETSPNSFGMTARDILLAPSDQVLNEFAGLKKFATFRDEEKKRRDRKTLGKKHRLRQWRRGIFGSEYERTGPTYGFERVMEEEDVAKGSVLETKEAKGEGSNIVGEVGETRKKKRKRSKGKKGAAATATAPTAEVEAEAEE
ncbi:hypothetical protein AK830_g10305 [Neonectria ditissima]|uniref:Kri1-like C-terminal domain-containing protein n=1 Tax=Neonectria ditissima TaxID=78410 RepID=A0A0P7B787_9HYPO|nr:hypothetical protein AK830_g10305 [Neonectria ditissima]